MLYQHFKYKLYYKNIYTARVGIQIHGTANVWPWQLKWLEHSAWIRRLGVRVPIRLRHFLSQKLRTFHKNIRSWVENEWCCPGTVNISNVNSTTKIFCGITPCTEKSAYISVAITDVTILVSYHSRQVTATHSSDLYITHYVTNRW